MKFEKSIELVEEILEPVASNPAIAGYKNHVYRVINFCGTLTTLDDEQRKKVAIAAAFHDLGIYTDNTFDYLPPSIDLARAYLIRNDLMDWSDEVTTMIDEHHCLHSIEGNELVEVFRKADLIDFSLGLVKFDLPRSTVSAVRNEFPNNGFHKNLARVACRWIARNPLNPVPVLKW